MRQVWQPTFGVQPLTLQSGKDVAQCCRCVACEGALLPIIAGIFAGTIVEHIRDGFKLPKRQVGKLSLAHIVFSEVVAHRLRCWREVHIVFLTELKHGGGFCIHSCQLN